MSITISTPVRSYSGVVAGVQFQDGTATVESLAPSARAYFERAGYVLGTVEADTTTGDQGPAPASFDGMKVADLRAYADTHDIDLGDATKKADIVAVLTDAVRDR